MVENFQNDSYANKLFICSNFLYQTCYIRYKLGIRYLQGELKVDTVG